MTHYRREFLDHKSEASKTLLTGKTNHPSRIEACRVPRNTSFTIAKAGNEYPFSIKNLIMDLQEFQQSTHVLAWASSLSDVISSQSAIL